MEFTDLRFLLFLAVVAVIYRTVPVRFRALLLVFASYVFYLGSSPYHAVLLLYATLASFLGALAIASAKSDSIKRGIMLAMVSGLVGILVFFKSVRFLPGFLHSLVLPLGISYYTFKLISYVMDVYRGKTTAERRLLPFTAYVAFFPQIVAGPIQRSKDFLPQLQNAPRVRLNSVVLGVQRILLGYFKKFVVADGLGVLVNFIYNHLYSSGTPVILGFYAFPLQLYADFSGLTDIAIGAALVLGIESPENFNAPFAAPNPSEFWRRWHITLTTWLTDYVFTPVRWGTRELGDAGLVLSLSLNMILIGLWHGFRWNYVLFGALHALYLSVDALTLSFRRRYYRRHVTANRLTNWIGPVVVFHLVAFSFVFFRAQTLTDCLYLLSHVGDFVGGLSAEFVSFLKESGRVIWVACAGVALAEAADYLRRHNAQSELVIALPRWGRWAVYSCTAATLAIMLMLLQSLNMAHNPFVYQVF